MISENTSQKRFGPNEGYESRSQPCLQDDLESTRLALRPSYACAASSLNYSLIFTG